MKPKVFSRLLSTLAVLIALALSVLPGSLAVAEDTGSPRTPGRAYGEGEGPAWVNPGNITSSGLPYTSAALGLSPDNQISEYLYAVNYGFSIPLGSTIHGIQVSITRMRSGEAGGVRDHAVDLVRWDEQYNRPIQLGANHARYPGWPSTMTTAIYGGPTDLWGETDWTAEQINHAEFGVAFAASIIDFGMPHTAVVDTIQVRVYYTPPATTTAVDCGSGTVEYGSSLSCSATVTRSAGSGTPGGQVSWATDGSGTFIPGSCELSGADGAAACTVTYTPGGVGDGSHQITAAYAGSANFNGSSGGQDVTVLKATPALSITNSPLTYNYKTQEAAVVSPVDGVVSAIRYNGSLSPPVNAGSYTISANFTSNDPNYMDLTDAPAGTLVIQKAVPTLWIINSPRTYNGEAQGAYVINHISGEIKNIRYDGKTELPVAAGTYNVRADFIPRDTNNFISVSGVSAGSFTISRRSVIVTGETKTKIYGDADPEFTYRITTGELAAGDTFTGGLTRDPGENVGWYVIRQGSLALSDNYTLLYYSDAVLNIDPAAPTLSITNSPVTYTGFAQNAVVTSPAPGLVHTIRYNGSESAPVNAGSYTVTVNFTSRNYNYTNLTGAVAGSFVIEPRPISVTADAKTRVYGEADPDLSYTYPPGALVEGDNFSGALTREPGEDAGAYAIDQGSLALSDNYALTYVGADLTIMPRSISVTADAKTRVYGEADPELKFTYTGTLVGSDAFSGALSRKAGEDAGKYAIEQNTLALTDNYALTYTGADLTITPRPISVTADDQTKIYGEADPAFTYQVTGTLVGSDAFSGALSRKEGDNVGAYVIEQGSLALSANYHLTYTGADLTITQATPKIWITGSPVTYNGSQYMPFIESSAEGIPSNLRIDGQAALPAALPVNAGTYAVSADFIPTDTLNYKSLSGANAGSFVIEPRPITVTANPQTRVFGEADPDLSYTYPLGALVEGDSFSGVLTRTPGEDAGTYAIHQGSLALSANYTLAFVGAELTITPATPTLSVSSSPVVYDGLPHAALVESPVEGEVSNILYDGQAALPVDPGIYAVTADFIPEDARNYASLTAAPAGNFTILAAEPALDFAISAAENSYSYAGDEIHYSYVLTNIGDVPLAGPFVVADDRASATCPESLSLAVMESITCTGGYTVTEADLKAGSVTNSALGSGSYAGEEVVSNEAKLTVIHKPANLYFPLIISSW